MTKQSILDSEMGTPQNGAFAASLFQKTRTYKMNLQAHGERLQVSGLRQLDSVNASVFRDRILAALTDTHRCVDLDLSQATLVDSCGLGALLSLQRKCDHRNTAMRLINPSSEIQQLLELTRMHQVFEVVEGS